MFATTRRRLGLELLESRLPLAGSVTAVKSGGHLLIEGDDAGNVITVESYGAGVLQVRGFNDFTGSPTFVNQGANALRLFYDITDITINMYRGNDVVRVTNLALRNHLIIDMDGGGDQLITGRHGATNQFGSTGSGPLYVNGQLLIDAGPDSDAVFQSDLHVTGASEIELGLGDDTLTLQRPAGSSANVEYFSDLDLFANAGIDTVNATGLISRSISLDDTAGRLNLSINSADIYGTLHVVSAGDSDALRVVNTNARGNLIIDTNAGNDLFTFLGIVQDLEVHAGDGADQVQVNSSVIDELVVELESGSDALQLSGLSARLMTVHGNDGDDLFDVRGVRATEAWFYGDRNTDTYREPIVPPNEIRRPHFFTIERFEVV